VDGQAVGERLGQSVVVAEVVKSAQVIQATGLTPE